MSARPKARSEVCMSLDKAIKHGRERRKPYRGSRAFDRSCRNHRSCSWCRDNRLYFDRKRRLSAALQQKEHENE